MIDPRWRAQFVACDLFLLRWCEALAAAAS
jgi:hypothetical protein